MFAEWPTAAGASPTFSVCLLRADFWRTTTANISVLLLLPENCSYIIITTGREGKKQSFLPWSLASFLLLPFLLSPYSIDLSFDKLNLCKLVVLFIFCYSFSLSVFFSWLELTHTYFNHQVTVQCLVLISIKCPFYFGSGKLWCSFDDGWQLRAAAAWLAKSWKVWRERIEYWQQIVPHRICCCSFILIPTSKWEREIHQTLSNTQLPRF